LGQGAPPASWGEAERTAFGQGALPGSAETTAIDVPAKLAEMSRAMKRVRRRRIGLGIGDSFERASVFESGPKTWTLAYRIVSHSQA